MENCEPKNNNLRVCVSGGHSSGDDPIYEQETYEMGRLIAKLGFRLDYGFSNSGVMGAVAKGVLDEWNQHKDEFYKEVSPIVGITTQEYYNLYQKDELLEKVTNVVVTDTIENRKKKLFDADIIVFAPGGVGTLDELAYDCVAMQDGFIETKPFIIYNINGFFHHILEYLKEMVRSGFAEPVPFIVVDNNEELEIAFRLLKLRYNECESFKEAYYHARKVAYELPYFIKKKVGKVWVEHLIAEMDDIELNGSKEQKEKLRDEIERAYLEKEIARMYDRLAKTGRDTAVVSEKLTKLKNSQLKKHS
ncbi:MAG: hypothetical protein E7017_06745 [Alphaproteobacteria bacterium]|nr:hypothetical protein [Alphaproteobacteria bacterium]